MPNFAALTPVATGTVSSITITPRLGDDGDRYIVGNLDLYAGKLLRIDSATGLGVPGNPHYAGNPADSVRARIWAHRFRNPFGFAFDPAGAAPDALYISENVDGTDHLARIEKGADGGWDPLFLTSFADGSRKILDTSGLSRTAIAFLRGRPFAPDGPVIYNARYDGDGVSNLLAYALGVSPLAPTPASALPATEIAEAGGERYLMLRVARDPEAAGLAYAVEATGDLATVLSWSFAATVTLTDTPTLLVVRDSESLGTEARRFLCLRVTLVDAAP